MVVRKRPDEELSMKPSQIRRRLRRNAARKNDRSLTRDLELYSKAAGFKPVSKWDIEELAHGKPRNKRGNFSGTTPSWVNAEVIKQTKKELHRRTYGKLASNIPLAIRTLKNLLESTEVDDKGKPLVDARTKLAASQFIIEHVIGKPNTVLELDATDNVRQMFAAAIVLDDGTEDTHLVIEGTVVAETEEEPEE
jgi:hypothetical protein